MGSGTGYIGSSLLCYFFVEHHTSLSPRGDACWHHQNSAYWNHCQGLVFSVASTRGRDIFQLFQEMIQGSYIAINGSSFFIAQGNLLKHLEQSIPRLKPLSAH